VLAVEAGGAPELDSLAVHQEARRAEALADLRVGEERGDRAVDVELGVGAGVAAVRDAELEAGPPRVRAWSSAPA
jgi:hypothetical protein